MLDWLRRRRRLLGAAFLLIPIVLGLWRIRAILAPFGLAAVLAYLLSPLVNFLVRRGFSRVAALVLVYVIVFLAGAVSIGLLVPMVIIELNRLAEFLPGYFAQLQEMLATYQEQYSQVQLPLAVRQAIDDAVLSIQARLLGLVGRAAQGILGVFGALFSLILAPILSFYLLKDIDRLRNGLRRYVPATDHDVFFRLLSEADAVMSGFIRGQLTVAVIVGSLMAVTLGLLRVRFAVILGIIAGITNVIPYFGPLLGAIPVLAVAAVGPPLSLLKALAAIIVIQQAESQLISPRVISKHVGLHPLAVIFALLVGLEIYGVLGMLIAVPIAGVMRVVLDFWFGSRGEEAQESAAGPAAISEPLGEPLHEALPKVK